MSSEDSLRPRISLSGMVWIVCGLILLVAKVGFAAATAPALTEYVGGFMILFGLIRLFWDLVRPRRTKPGFWSKVF